MTATALAAVALVDGGDTPDADKDTDKADQAVTVGASSGQQPTDKRRGGPGSGSPRPRTGSAARSPRGCSPGCAPTTSTRRCRPGRSPPASPTNSSRSTNYRGRIRGQLLRVEPGEAGPAARLRGTPPTWPRSRRSPTCSTTTRSRRINGDFFDIHDTGAPLGVGRDRDRGTLHGVGGGLEQRVLPGPQGRLAHRAPSTPEPRSSSTRGCTSGRSTPPSVRPQRDRALHRGSGAPRRGYRIVDGQRTRRPDGHRPARPGDREPDPASPSTCRVRGQLLVGRNAGADRAQRG